MTIIPLKITILITVKTKTSRLKNSTRGKLRKQAYFENRPYLKVENANFFVDAHTDTFVISTIRTQTNEHTQKTGT